MAHISASGAARHIVGRPKRVPGVQANPQPAHIKRHPCRRRLQWCGYASALVIVALGLITAMSGCDSSAGASQTQPAGDLATEQPADISLPAVTTTPVPTLPPSTSTPTPAPSPPPAPVAPPPPAAPTAAPVGGSGCYINPEGNCYRAGQYCPNAMHGQTIQGASGPLKCEDVNDWRWEPV